MIADAASPAPWPAPLPAELSRGPLLAAGGYTVVDGICGPDLLAALRAEARACFPRAERQDVAEPDDSRWRGGAPERTLWSASGAAIQDGLYRAPGLAAVLAGWSGLPMAPSGERGSYSYYLRPGDHLGLHRDVDACDLAVITCLAAEVHEEPGRGQLVLYPERVGEPLDQIRRDPSPGRRPLRLRAGQTLLLLGGLVPHQVVPLAPGERRVVSVLCFRGGGGSS